MSDAWNTECFLSLSWSLSGWGTGVRWRELLALQAKQWKKLCVVSVKHHCHAAVLQSSVFKPVSAAAFPHRLTSNAAFYDARQDGRRRACQSLCRDEHINSVYVITFPARTQTFCTASLKVRCECFTTISTLWQIEYPALSASCGRTNYIKKLTAPCWASIWCVCRHRVLQHGGTGFCVCQSWRHLKEVKMSSSVYGSDIKEEF